MGLFGGTQIETNKEEFSAECHSVDCCGDSKVLTELQIVISIEVIVLDDQKSRELRRIRTTGLAVYFYEIYTRMLTWQNEEQMVKK